MDQKHPIQNLIEEEPVKKEIRLSVRKLVEFILRSGSIDNRFGGFDRANQGARLHRKIQKAAGDNYQAEISLSNRQEYGGVLFFVEGRADGLITVPSNVEGQESGLIIDEIKTTGMPLELIDDSISQVHWAQAMCYGYFLSKRDSREQIDIQLTYCHIETEETRILKKSFSFSELEDFYLNLLDRYLQWAKLEIDWIRKRNQSVKKLVFPFPAYRRGQRPLAIAVYKTIAAGGKLFCQAPTGIGKTISTLFPAIKAIGEEKASKVFYLTAKTITRQAAENAAALLRQASGLQLKTITLTAKDKICFQPEPNCNPDICTYAKGHYDRVNQAIYDLLQTQNTFSRQEIEAAARKFEVCPFELALDLTLWCDCIICDYNYVFDPQVSLKRFFAEQKKTDFVFLIDEAHNLADRAKEMYSARLTKSEFWNIKKLLPPSEQTLHSVLSKINKEFIMWKKSCEEAGFFTTETCSDSFQKLLYRFTEACEKWLEQNRQSEEQKQLLQVYFDALTFQRTLELYDSRYITFYSLRERDVQIRLLCLDPSVILASYMRLGKAAVLFSATLTPLPYFLSLLNSENDAKKMILPSPYPQENLKLLAAAHISTLYKSRERSIQAIAALIYQASRVKTGNYMVYFPSYQYLNAVYACFQEQHGEVETIVQETGMTEEEREVFLEKFSADNIKTLIGFCVLGGIYSEGIDLKGERLIGAIIIGVGLPQVDPEQNILKNYYDKQCQTGFEYAYQFPGFNKVLQAAGRVIRSETDKGVVLLVDSRFAESRYRSLFPEHWKHCQVLYSNEAVESALQRFWLE